MGRAPVAAYHGRITALLEPHRPDPALPGTGFLPDARVVMLEGPASGRELGAYLQGPGGQQDTSSYRVGEEVVVTVTESGTANPAFVAVNDRWRLPQLGWLLLAFALAVAAVGGWRGVRALIALGLTGAVVVRILVPLILQGVPPIPVAVAIATAITVVTVWMTEGLSRVGVAAILGTAGSLAFTAFLAAITITVAGFSGAVGEELIYLQTAPGLGLDLRGLLLAAFMLGAIGVLDDVTVTQAAAVDELVRHSDLRGRRLFASAMNIGRSHVAAIVNTLFLAYLGASLPLVILFAVSAWPGALILNGEPVAIEIVRTLVGSLGILAAVPFTTAVAVWLSTRHRPTGSAVREPGATGSVGAEPAAFVLGLIAIGTVTVLAAVALSPWIFAPPRAVVVPDRFGPSSEPAVQPSPASSRLPGASASATSPAASPAPIWRVGEAIPVTEAGSTLGTVTVLGVQVGNAGGASLNVEIRYLAERPFRIDPEAWVATSRSGGGAVGRPSTIAPPLVSRTLQATDAVTAWLEFDIAAAPADTSLVYFGTDGTPLFVVRLG
jgi:uncharacterized membrane protein